MDRKTRVLFLCTQNSARSQMAEGFLRHHGGEEYEAHSAGYGSTDAVDPLAVRVMEEVGVDIADQYPKGLKTYMGKAGFNFLVIVCPRAEEDCPKTFPGVGTTFSWPFANPRGRDIPEEEALERFREVRDAIEVRIVRWLEDPEEELVRLREERERKRRERAAGGTESVPNGV